ncbi:MAG: 4-hydroxy-tetrahydrodipicolinate synthase [Ignavibacteria bacterium]|nr:4-hydroxy-tetrahydrodipicolinate synthase [Ignavibacteria bacterium]
MFRGVGTALITPFNGEGEIDLESMTRVVKDQVAGGVSMLIVLGTTGESPVISDNERVSITETVIEAAEGKAKVIVGTGTNDTRKTVKLNKLAEDCGAEGLLIVNPYYNKSTQSGLVDHYSYICEQTSLPVILYNVPSRTGMNVAPETVLEIHQKNPNVIAVKEASGDISQIARLCAMKPESLTVLSGNDDQTLPIMSLGARGVISVFSNVYPKLMTQIVEACLAGNYAEALQIHTRCLRMMNVLFLEASPIPVKYACSVRGLCSNTLRLPLVPVTAKTAEIISAEMNKMVAFL